MGFCLAVVLFILYLYALLLVASLVLLVLELVVFTAIMLLGVVGEPLRLIPDPPTPARLAEHDKLVKMIAGARKPVASENMTLLMQAGKPVIYEPAIVTELALTGRWDERPLVQMIRDHGFAFMITSNNTSRMSPAVLAAMHEAYPRVETAGQHLFLNLPPQPDPANGVP